MLESSDLEILTAVKRERVKAVPKTGRSTWGGVPADAIESRAWSLGGNVD